MTGEEHGLLGAKYWVNHPTWPIDKLVANFNFDGIGTEVYGPLKKIVGFGAEHSDLGAVLDSVAAATGNVLTPDPMPEEKVFYRSDHYEFSRGSAALMLMGGPDSKRKPMSRDQKVDGADYTMTGHDRPTELARPARHRGRRTHRRDARRQQRNGAGVAALVAVQQSARRGGNTER